MALSQRGIELLLEVKRRGLEEPSQRNMNEWLQREESPAAVGNGSSSYNTIACIAGDLLIVDALWRGVRPPRTYLEFVARGGANRASSLLGEDYLYLFFNLFYVSCWPADLRRSLRWSRPGTREYAEVVGEAIDRFIANGGYW